jgi:uncharacterized protein (DUF885 family)
MLATALPAAAQPQAVAPAPAAPAKSPQDAAFEAFVARMLQGEFRSNPVFATLTGEHRYDALLPDMSAAGRKRATEARRGWLAELGRLDRAALSRDNQVDAAMIVNALRQSIWTATELQDWAWDPQVYGSVAGNALYSLAKRDFAPWRSRLLSATARMEKLPTLLAQARAELVPARVPRIHAETVTKQTGGIMSIVDTMLTPQAGALSAAERKRYDAAVATARAAVSEHQAWLERTLVPNARGDSRLGAQLYDRKLAFALDSTLGRAEIKRRAEAAFAETRAEMYRVATDVLKGRSGAPVTPEKPTPDQVQAAIEAALELTYADRPSRDGVIDAARERLAEATAFVRAKNLVTVPDRPVRIITMPEFEQGVAVAYCDPPGPLEKHLGTFYAVSPIPKDWSDAQATSFLREYNNYMIHDLNVHEAMPGHYLQLAHANDHPSVPRAVLYSGPFVEGWAVYAEGMMADAGFVGPLYRLTVLKMRLRTIANALLDIGIQAEGMSREAAMRLMIEGAFQQEREAAGKWVRAQLTSAQLPTYFVGWQEHEDLRREARKRAGRGFDLRRHNDAVLSHGAPPVRYVRQLMLGEKIG